jgi:hypothetical protein
MIKFYLGLNMKKSSNITNSIRQNNASDCLIFKKYFSSNIIFGLLFLCLLLQGFSGYATTYYSTQDGFWNSNSTWSTSSRGSSGSSHPGAGDVVIIEHDDHVTINSNATVSCKTLYITIANFAGNGGTLIFLSGSILNVSGDVTVGTAGNNNDQRIGIITMTLGGTINCNGDLTLGNDGGSSITQGASSSISIGGSCTILQPGNNNHTNAWNINAGSADVSGLISFTGGNTNSSRVGRITITTGTLDANGGISFTGSASANKVIDMSGGAGTLNMKGSLTVPANSSTLNAGTSGSIFNYADATSAQTINFFSAGAYLNLHINTTGGIGASLSAPITAALVTGNIRVQSGTFNNGGFAIGMTGSKVFEVVNGATFNLSGTSSMVTGTSISKVFGASSTTNYSGSTQTISAENYGHLILSGSGVKTAPAGTLTVQGNLSKSGTASFAHNNGLVLLNGVTQSFAGLDYYDLEMTGGTKTTDGNSTIKDYLQINSNAVLSIKAAEVISLLSTVSKTASVRPLLHVTPSTAINYNTTGKIEVQRYINTGTAAGQHPKGWQFVASPVTGVSIRDAWMEGGGALPLTPNGYGAFITAPAGVGGGFDAYTATPSIKTFLSGAGAGSWIAVPSATAAINNQQGYMIFIRGDRSVFSFSGANSTATTTVLRAKGQIVTGPQTSLTVNAGQFQSVANPYPSAVDFSAVTINGGASSNYIAWDPSLMGTYGLGGYQTITAALGYKPTPGNYNNISGVTPIYVSGNTYPNIQSGQAIFISAPFSAGSVTFNEVNKATGSSLVNRGGANSNNTINDIKMIATNLLAVSGTNLVMADGNAVVFDSVYSNGVDVDDASKLLNGGENFGLTRNGLSLAVEARGNLNSTDTLFYQLNNVRQQAYRLMFIPQNLGATGFTAELVDGYLNSRTAVSLVDTNYVDISFTADALSRASNRFMLVFKPAAGPLPVTIVSVSAYRNTDRSIGINWAVENQLNIDHYEVERSGDGRSFTGILTVAAEGSNNGNSVRYSKTDLSPLAADNYYRIKAVSISGQLQYSAIMKVAPDKSTAGIRIYPNPVVGRTVQVQFNNQAKGSYSLQVNNEAGQVIYQGKASVNSSNFVQSIQLAQSVSGGVYHLQIKNEAGTISTQSLLLQ